MWSQPDLPMLHNVTSDMTAKRLTRLPHTHMLWGSSLACAFG